MIGKYISYGLLHLFTIDTTYHQDNNHISAALLLSFFNLVDSSQHSENLHQLSQESRKKTSKCSPRPSSFFSAPSRLSHLLLHHQCRPTTRLMPRMPYANGRRMAAVRQIGMITASRNAPMRPAREATLAPTLLALLRALVASSDGTPVNAVASIRSSRLNGGLKRTRSCPNSGNGAGTFVLQGGGKLRFIRLFVSWRTFCISNVGLRETTLSWFHLSFQ